MIAQLTGNVSVSATIGGEFAVRAEVKDEAAFAKTVEKIAKALPQFGLGENVTREGNLFTLHGSDGGSYSFGVANGALVVATDAARARAMALSKPEAVEGASGSLVLRADAEGIARQILAQIAPQFGIPDPVVPVFAKPFDELRGSIVTSTDGMKGKFSLTLD